MKKLIDGILEFREKKQKDYLEKFGKLATGQSPDALFIACSDSRVVPNTFASTNPGDLFVLRNVGNLIPTCDSSGSSTSDESEAAAIEFAIANLEVNDIIVCGHSECGAMKAVLNGRSEIKTPNLKLWLRHGEEALNQLNNSQLQFDDESLSDQNKLSQLNVLNQIEHIKSYPEVIKRVDEGKLNLHAWWFDIRIAEVFAYSKKNRKFIPLSHEIN